MVVIIFYLPLVEYKMNACTGRLFKSKEDTGGSTDIIYVKKAHSTGGYA